MLRRAVTATLWALLIVGFADPATAGDRQDGLEGSVDSLPKPSPAPQPPPDRKHPRPQRQLTLAELEDRAAEIFDREGCVEIGMGTVGSCSPPPGRGPRPVDAQVLALSAFAQTPIPAPAVHMSPETNLPAIVNLQQWLWITSGWQAYTATASTGLATVTVTAVPQRVVWNMGEGSTSCADAGKPWAKGMGDAVTTCGFTYRLPHTGQAVSAWVEYEASWTCSGLCSNASGTVGLVTSEPWEGNLEVRERQTVVTR